MIFIIILFVLVLVVVYFKRTSYFENEIPKIIWTYWKDPNIPPLVQKCIKNWEKYAPEYRIQMITEETVKNWVTPPEWFWKLTPPRQSDWIRLYLLDQYGGVWMDASVVLTEPLSNWIPKSGVFLFHQNGMTINKQYPVYESWFIATNPGHPFIKAYFTDFNSICEKYGNDGEKYLRSFSDEDRKKVVQNMSIPDYLTIYVSAQKLTQLDGWDPKLIQTRKSEDGPLMWHFKFQWKFEDIAKFFMGPFEGSHPMLIKIVGPDRKALDQLKEKNWPLHDKSILKTYLDY